MADQDWIEQECQRMDTRSDISKAVLDTVKDALPELAREQLTAAEIGRLAIDLVSRMNDREIVDED